MKNFFKFLSIAGVIASFAMMAACTDSGTDKGDPTPDPDPTPDTPTVTYSMSVAQKEVNPSEATFELSTENIASYAYLIQAKADAFDVLPDVVLATGILGNCDESGKTLVTIKNLMPESSYIAKFVGIQTNEEFYKDVIAVEITTGKFSGEVTFFNVDYLSASVNIQLPEGTIKEGNVVKWGLFDVVTLNMEEGQMTDAERLNQHDAVYANYFTKEVTLTFNEENNWFTPPAEYANDENELIARYYPLSAGQPSILMLGEFSYNPIESDWRAGWGPGYYDWCFDMNSYLEAYYNGVGQVDQNQYWTGYHKRIPFTTKEPDDLGVLPDIDINLTPKGTGSIDVTFKDGIAYCCVAVVDDATYKVIMPYLNNDKSLLPWYVTSYNAFMNIGAISLEKSTPLVAENYFYLERDVKYHLFAAALNDDASKRSYYETTFKLPQPTLPAPVAEIKAVPNPETGKTSDSAVWFNLRAVNGDADVVRYIANYEREWMAMQNQYTKAGYTEQEALLMMLNQYGGYIPEKGSTDTSELKKINSAEGLTIEFSSRADANNICGFVIYNTEGTPSQVVLAESRTDKEPAATPIASTLYDDLKGEWTLTATVTGQEYINNILTPFTRSHSSDVTIGDISYESTLPEEVYMIYSRQGMDKEEVDAIYAQFRTAVDDFNKQTRAQNRILCQGFDFENYEYRGISYAAYRNPYELFIDPEYSGYDYESPIYDFGPKWYFQVQEGGTSVAVPFNVSYFAPAAQWLYYVYQFMPVSDAGYLPYLRNEYAQIETGYCPVEIAEDKNTITIKPYIHTDGKPYYLNLCRYFESAGEAQVPLKIVSDIVMTRKSGTAPATAKVAKSAKAECSVFKADKPIVTKKARWTSRTAFNTTAKIVKPETRTFRPINLETFQQNVKNYIKKLHGESVRETR